MPKATNKSSPQVSILNLPEDILANVFSLLNNENSPVLPGARCGQLMRITQTCRTFRQIAHNRPTLWVDVHSHMHTEIVKLRLKLSGAVDINVVFYDEDRGTTGVSSPRISQLANFWELVHPHRQRWRSGQRSVLSLAIVHRSEASLGAPRASTLFQQGEVCISVSKVVLILTCCFTVLTKPRAYTAQSRMN